MNKNNKAQNTEQLQQENEELRFRLAESQATINAMRNMHEDTLEARGAIQGKYISSSLSENSACLFFAKLNEAALIISAQGKIISCNTHFTQLMNTVSDLVTGSDVLFFILPEWHIKFKSLLNNFRKTGKSENIAFQPEGHLPPVQLRVSLSPLSESGESGEIGVIAIDVSPYKKIEDELRDAHNTLEKRVAERTANLAHANEELVKARIATLSMMGDTVEVMNELEITNSKLLEEIGERKKSEVKLEQANEQLHALTSRIVTVREEERTALSREIHDELGSALTGVKMGLIHIKRSLPGDERSESYANMHEILASMTNIIDGTIRMVRKIITDLRPEILDEVGLAEALQWYGGEFGKRTSISIRFTVFPKKFEIDKKQTTELFRIFQEILANVAKHSGASKVVVFLKKENDFLTLRVKDDGIGIKETDMANKNSFGIMGIRERAKLMGGQMNIKGAPGRGTTITIEVPGIETE
jgi:signal transduction histidine kinase/PAS domain-containing protein